MHVISQDFISSSLTNKKHWNSFTTEFFKDVEEIEKILEDKGQIKVISSCTFSYNIFEY